MARNEHNPYSAVPINSVTHYAVLDGTRRRHAAPRHSRKRRPMGQAASSEQQRQQVGGRKEDAEVEMVVEVGGGGARGVETAVVCVVKVWAGRARLFVVCKGPKKKSDRRKIAWDSTNERGQGG